jgi:hypothetical protein
VCVCVGRNHIQHGTSTQFILFAICVLFAIVGGNKWKRNVLCCLFVAEIYLCNFASYALALAHILSHFMINDIVINSTKYCTAIKLDGHFVLFMFTALRFVTLWNFHCWRYYYCCAYRNAYVSHSFIFRAYRFMWNFIYYHRHNRIFCVCVMKNWNFSCCDLMEWNFVHLGSDKKSRIFFQLNEKPQRTANKSPHFLATNDFSFDQQTINILTKQERESFEKIKI